MNRSIKKITRINTYAPTYCRTAKERVSRLNKKKIRDQLTTDRRRAERYAYLEHALMEVI